MKLTMRAFLFFLLTGFCGFLYASETTGCEDWGKMGVYGTKYDVKTVVTISGEINAVRKIALGKRTGRFCYAIDLKDGEKVHTAYLGSGSYINRQGFTFAPGNKVVVTGSSVIIDDRPIVLAKDINAEGRILRIRDDNGKHF